MRTSEPPRSGRASQLTGTHEHPVLTLASPFELRWTRLADLQPGDRVAVERHRELWPSQAPALDLFAPDLVVERRKLRYPAEMTPELARLLGYLVAEGSVEQERFRFSSADPEVMADYCRCVQAVFGVDPRGQVRDRVHPTTGVRTEYVELSWLGALQFLAVLRPAGRALRGQGHPARDSALSTIARARVPGGVRRG